MRSAGPGTSSPASTEADPFWPAQLALLGAILLYVALPGKLTIGPGWLLPAVEGVAFVGLLTASPILGTRPRPWRKQVALTLLGLVTAVNLASVILLARLLVQGAQVRGEPLLLGGLALWLTQILVFGVWLWEVDRGGPDQRAQRPDLLFPQMQGEIHGWGRWQPVFSDYLYVSLTNATAFSPTDTLPLTRRAKALMGLQSLGSLTTLALVVARAVNIIG